MINETCIFLNFLFISFSRVGGYWIGGYNFHKDIDMEWVSQPDQVMPFSDMGGSEPNNPGSEFCMVMWPSFGFQWGDYPCDRLVSYICEFVQL